MLCKSSVKGNIKDDKVVLGESVTSQHRTLVFTLISNKATKRKPSRAPRTKWWKLPDPDFRDQSRNIIQQRVGEGTQDGETATEDMRQLGETFVETHLDI